MASAEEEEDVLAEIGDFRKNGELGSDLVEQIPASELMNTSAWSTVDAQFSSLMTSRIRRFDGTVKLGPWKNLADLLRPVVLMKIPFVSDWLELCSRETMNLLRDQSKQHRITDFVNATLDKIGAKAKPIVFFKGRFEFPPDCVPVYGVVSSDRKLVVIKEGQKLIFNGKISYFLAKNEQDMVFGFSSGLVVNMQLCRQSTWVGQLINEVIQGVELKPGVAMMRCFAELADEFPIHTCLSGYLLNVIMTPELEMLLQWEHYQWENIGLLRRLSYCILVIFARSHVHTYLVKAMVPIYLESLRDYHQVFSVRSFTSEILDQVYDVIEPRGYEKVAFRIKDILEGSDDHSVYMKRILKVLLRWKFTVQLRMVIQCLWRTCLAFYGENRKPAFYILSRFIFSKAIRVLKEVPELRKKLAVVESVFDFDDGNPDYAKYINAFRVVIVELCERPFRPSPISGLSQIMYRDAQAEMYRLFTENSALFIELAGTTLLNCTTPIESIMQGIFMEADKDNREYPEMSLFIQVFGKRRRKWLEAREVPEEDIPKTMVPLWAINGDSRDVFDDPKTKSEEEPKDEPEPKRGPEPPPEPEKKVLSDAEVEAQVRARIKALQKRGPFIDPGIEVEEEE